MIFWQVCKWETNLHSERPLRKTEQTFSANDQIQQVKILNKNIWKMSSNCLPNFSFPVNRGSVTFRNSSSMKTSLSLYLLVMLVHVNLCHVKSLNLFQYLRVSPTYQTFSRHLEHRRHLRNMLSINEFAKEIRMYSSKYLRTDIVFDAYISGSLKAETRSKRGMGARRRVTASGKIPPIWQSFLRDSRNKTVLFDYLAEKPVELEGNMVVATLEEVSSQTMILKSKTF